MHVLPARLIATEADRDRWYVHSATQAGGKKEKKGGGGAGGRGVDGEGGGGGGVEWGKEGEGSLRGRMWQEHAASSSVPVCLAN